MWKLGVANAGGEAVRNFGVLHEPLFVPSFFENRQLPPGYSKSLWSGPV